MSETPRAQLIHIDVDRRLGHEWDEWDGKPLPNRGNYDSPPALFFAWSAVALVVGLGLVALVALPARSPARRPPRPRSRASSGAALAGAAVVLWAWWGVLFLSYATGRPLLPERLAERGPFLRLMRLTSRVADRFGRRDWVENASVKVYNALALLRGRKVGKGELLLLIPRCLSKETLDGVLGIAGKYGVPVFVATRGQLARRVIRERRPRAVVAVACERDMVSGLHDVAGKIPVLGLTMTLPSGPCKDALLEPGAAGGVGAGVRGVSATSSREGMIAARSRSFLAAALDPRADSLRPGVRLRRLRPSASRPPRLGAGDWRRRAAVPLHQLLQRRAHLDRHRVIARAPASSSRSGSDGSASGR